MEIRRGDIVHNVEVLDLDYRQRPNGMSRASAYVRCLTCQHQYTIRLDNLIKGRGDCRPCREAVKDTTVDKGGGE